MKIRMIRPLPRLDHVIPAGQVLDCPEGFARKMIRTGRAVPAEKGQDMAAGVPSPAPDEDISEAGMQEKSEPAEAGDRESGQAADIGPVPAAKGTRRKVRPQTGSGEDA